MSKDPHYRKMINSARWQHLRRSVLSAHSLCERCLAEGFVTPAHEVHHIRPVESAVTFAEKERLMFDPANLRALCHECHVRTHKEMGRRREDIRKRNAEQTAHAIRRLFGGSKEGGGF